MARNIVFRIVAAVVLIAALAGIGYVAYTAGAAHATTVTVPAPAAGAVTQPYPYMMGWHFTPFFGLGCFIPLALLFLVFVAFGSLRRLIWGPRWGWHHMDRDMMGHGPWGRHGPWGEGVPPMFAEMHRKAHADPNWDKAPEEKKD
jgi:uncharacterized membrane protein